MTTKTGKTAGTFEDRLLGELQREIALRAADRTEEEPVIRRRVTPRRALVALTACAVAAGVVVAVPSSTGGPQAYALERHKDGSVTLTFDEIVALSWDDKSRLIERLSAEGIFVSVDKPRSGFVCEQPRGKMPPERTVTYNVKTGELSEPLTYTLHPGDTLAFEEPERVKDDVSPAWSMYMVEGRIKPCKEVPFEGLVGED
ncbi:hypothetical protein ACIQVC_38280 [Streptomyces sp. NPDC101112]|uniref:hypothetical protein n=1 Tax=Streptomyces sp. NPDC101112 TaxID=3366105 RepID=UPI0038213505